MDTPGELRVIVYQEKTKQYDIWVAQCLEFDIAAHGEKPDAALYEFERLFIGHLAAARDSKIDPLTSIPKAPEFFFNLWEKADVNISPVDGDRAARDFRFALPSDSFAQHHARCARLFVPSAIAA